MNGTWQKIIEELEQNDLRNYFKPVFTVTDSAILKGQIDLLKSQLTSDISLTDNDESKRNPDGSVGTSFS